MYPVASQITGSCTVYFHNLSYPIISYFIPSHPILPHPISSFRKLILSYFNPPHSISFNFISPHPIVSFSNSFHSILSQFTLSYLPLPRQGRKDFFLLSSVSLLFCDLPKVFQPRILVLLPS